MQSLAKFLAAPQALHLGEVNSTGKSRIANLGLKGAKPSWAWVLSRFLRGGGLVLSRCDLSCPFSTEKRDRTQARRNARSD